MAWGFYSWGNLDLLVAKGSYNPPSTSIGLTEIQIIPNPENLNPDTILQQGSLIRKRASFKGYATKADYESLENDFIGVVSRTFTDINSVSFTGIIENLSSGYDFAAEYYTYNISIVEV